MSSLWKRLALALTLSLAAGTPSRAEGPWQLSLGVGATKGMLSLGRDLGSNYLGLGLHGLAYSNRDGWVVVPALAYQRRFHNPYLPYLGLSADVAYGFQDEAWGTPHLLPALGYELRFRHIYAHVEAILGTPMDTHFGKRWGVAGGAGIGIPF